MTLLTTTYDPTTHKLVPLEPTDTQLNAICSMKLKRLMFFAAGVKKDGEGVEAGAREEYKLWVNSAPRHTPAAPPAPKPESNVLTIQDYEESFADYRRLVRELDALLNGVAAKQASFCDIVSQVRHTGTKIKQSSDSTA